MHEISKNATGRMFRDLSAMLGLNKKTEILNFLSESSDLAKVIC